MRVLEAIDERELDALTAGGEFFWLDVAEPSRDEVAALARRFGWHPLVEEDLCHFGQRPKLENYDDRYLFIVFYGARHDERGEPALTEVHLVISGEYVITVRRRECRDLEAQQARLRARSDVAEQFVVYSILDALTDSFFPVIEELDDRLDELEDMIVRSPGDQDLQRVFVTKRLIADLRRAVTPQRDLAATALEDLAELPGLDAGAHDYFRDLYDHLIRIADTLDSYRDLLTSITDVYMSTVSNRMNAVMKQLTIIATIFLPLTFVTGFFGQNFGWLVRHITSLGAFLVLGIGGLIVPCVGLLVLFRRQGYLRSDV